MRSPSMMLGFIEPVGTSFQSAMLERKERTTSTTNRKDRACLRRRVDFSFHVLDIVKLLPQASAGPTPLPDSSAAGPAATTQAGARPYNTSSEGQWPEFARVLFCLSDAAGGRFITGVAGR